MRPVTFPPLNDSPLSRNLLTVPPLFFDREVTLMSERLPDLWFLSRLHRAFVVCDHDFPIIATLQMWRDRLHGEHPFWNVVENKFSGMRRVAQVVDSYGPIQQEFSPRAKQIETWFWKTFLGKMIAGQ